MKNFEDFKETALKAISQAEELMIVNDILDIYKGKYSTYYTYKCHKNGLIALAKEQNNKTCELEDNAVKTCFYLEPKILPFETWSYIRQQREIDEKKEDKEK